MREHRHGLGPVLVGAMCIVLWAWGVQPAAGSDPQPTGGAGTPNCTGVSGVVVNWGFRNEPGVTLSLSGGGYEVTQVSGAEGQYEFGGMGQGYALLRPVLPSAQAQSLHVLADQIGVPLTCGQPAVVNVGLYSGDKRPQTPAHLQVVAQGNAAPGAPLTLTVSVKNDLPTGISHVVVTDLLPERLQYVGAKAAKVGTAVLDGRMLVWNLDHMAAGETALATWIVRVNPAAENGDLIANRISLLYAEAIADQALTTIAVGQGLASELAEAESAAPASGKMEAPAPATAKPTVSARVEITPSLPLVTGTIPLAEGQAPTKLPTTGAPAGGMPMPLVGVGLVAVAALARFLRHR